MRVGVTLLAQESNRDNVNPAYQSNSCRPVRLDAGRNPNVVPFNNTNLHCVFSRALKVKEHIIRSKRVRVKAADSWKQTTEARRTNGEGINENEDDKYKDHVNQDGENKNDENKSKENENVQIKNDDDESVESENFNDKSDENGNDENNGDDKSNNNADNETDDKKMSKCFLLELNDDCLLHIFSFLPLRERLMLANMEKHFKEVFITMLKIKKRLDLKEIGADELAALTLIETRNLITNYGIFIEIIKFQTSFARSDLIHFVDYIPNHCKKLRIIELNGVTTLRINAVFSPNLESLTHVKLVRCNITDEKISFLSRLPIAHNLMLLDLSENYEITGQYLYRFKKLEHLSLASCLNLQTECFAEICNHLTSLRELNVQRCDFVAQESFKLIPKKLKDLHTLTFSINYHCRFCADISKLKSLTILYSIFNHSLFEFLAMKEEHILEKLTLYSGNLNEKQLESLVKIKSLKDLRFPLTNEITDKTLIDISKSLKLLEYLDLTGNRRVINHGICSLIRFSKNLHTIDITQCVQFEDDLIHVVINQKS